MAVVKKELHTIDADGDLRMQLFRQIVNDSDLESTGKTESPPTESSEVEDGNNNDALALDTTLTPVSGVVAEEETQDETGHVGAPQGTISDTEVSKVSPEPELEESTILVSSRHMALASPVFRSMLDKNKFTEGHTLHAEGNVQISFPDDDPDAFLVLLHIIHGKTRAVDRTPDLKLLLELAVLVDKYQCLEIVEIFADIWVENLQKVIGLPSDYTEDVIPWIYISWVFENAAIFQEMTKIVQGECDDKVEDDIEEGIPVPQVVISSFNVALVALESLANQDSDSILSSRMNAIEQALKFMSNLIGEYMMTPEKAEEQENNDDSPPRKNWQWAQDAMVLGSLINGVSKLGVWPLPQQPFDGIIYQDLSEGLKKLQVFFYCSEPGHKEVNTSEDLEMMSNIDDKMSDIDERLCGLSLKELKRRD